MGRPRLSPLSAALTIATWAQAHGRPPRCTECTGHDGLHWFPTYYEAFALSTWSAILREVRSLTSGYAGSGMGIVVLTTKPCLNAPECPALIPDEGPGVRLCLPCRLAATRGGVATEPLFVRQRWRRLGVADVEGEDWVEGVDWFGGTHGGL